MSRTPSYMNISVCSSVVA